MIDLHALLNDVYDRSGYHYFIDYHLDPTPPLSEADASWLDTLLHEKGLR